MQEKVGIIRNQESLEEALNDLEGPEQDRRTPHPEGRDLQPWMASST